jgi:probable phosphoglycerate mutase
LPLVYLARHGETAWSRTGQHTGLTDLPLTEQGRAEARELGERLRELSFTRVLVSPLLRAKETCEGVGLGDRAEIEPDLVEWNYGDFEGKRTTEIRETRPDWQLFRDGCSGGESVAEISARADRLIAKVRSMSENIILFSSGHISRVIAARWLGLDASAGRYFLLTTASLSALGYEHNLSEPVIRLWNDSWRATAPASHTASLAKSLPGASAGPK